MLWTGIGFRGQGIELSICIFNMLDGYYNGLKPMVGPLGSRRGNGPWWLQGMILYPYEVVPLEHWTIVFKFMIINTL
jgi:hypothetical protein